MNANLVKTFVASLLLGCMMVLQVMVQGAQAANVQHVRNLDGLVEQWMQNNPENIVGDNAVRFEDFKSALSRPEHQNITTQQELDALWTQLRSRTKEQLLEDWKKKHPSFKEENYEDDWDRFMWLVIEAEDGAIRGTKDLDDLWASASSVILQDD